MQIFVNPNYNFVRWRIYWFLFSVLFIIAGLIVYSQKGVDLGIDFAGGASVVLKFREEPPIQQLRSQLPDATIQQYGKPAERSVLIRLPQVGRQEGDYAGRVVTDLNRTLNPESASGRNDLNYYGKERLSELLKSTDPDVKGTNPTAQQYYNDLAERIINRRSEIGIFSSMQQVTGVPGVSGGVARVLNEKAFLGKFNLLSQETVGPQVGKELQSKAFWAIVASAIAMGIYISLRFDLMFGVSAVACIIHDVLVSLAFLVMMRLEFSLNVVAALLTIVGYSINDTVVMYDRVRENRRKTKKQNSIADELNVAMNQTLSRTILTSGSVALVLVAMIAFGGSVIRSFSWVLLIGVISGTYSTISIVPAVAIWWDRMRGGRRKALAPTPTPSRPEFREPQPAVRKRRVS